MEEQLITFETAKLAKEKGFDLTSDKGYYKHGSEKDFSHLLLWRDSEPNEPEFGYAPTQSILQKWLREVHNHIVFVRPYSTRGDYVINCYRAVIYKSKKYEEFSIKETWEEALEEGLKIALNYIK